MFFDDCVWGFLPGVPSFNCFYLDDYNPLSGRRKRRKIYAPNDAMKVVHARLVKWIRALPIEQPSATGARPRMSPLRNVLRHLQHDGPRTFFPRYFFLTDISGAYGSVDAEKLTDILMSVSEAPEKSRHGVRTFLKWYCLAPEGGLIVGAPASPDLFNLYCEVLIDEKLRGLCENFCVTYTRYLDDLTFSSVYPIGRKKRIRFLRAIRDPGFKTNNTKTQVHDLTVGPITINGIGIYANGKLFFPGHAMRRLQGMLHSALRGRVPMKVVHGHMAAFRFVIRGRKRSQAEEKIFQMYNLLRITENPTSTTA